MERADLGVFHTQDSVLLFPGPLDVFKLLQCRVDSEYQVCIPLTFSFSAVFGFWADE